MKNGNQKDNQQSLHHYARHRYKCRDRAVSHSLNSADQYQLQIQNTCTQKDDAEIGNGICHQWLWNISLLQDSFGK